MPQVFPQTSVIVLSKTSGFLKRLLVLCFKVVSKCFSVAVDLGIK